MSESDTPMTDAHMGESPQLARALCDPDFARSLERELAAANKARGQIDGLKARIAELNADRDKYKRAAERLADHFEGFATRSAKEWLAWAMEDGK